MKVFEIHFNPKLKPNIKFDSFCYVPESNFERKMGNLYMVGLLTHALAKDKLLIQRLTTVIKDKYYGSTSFSPEKALKESLKAGNTFLESLTKRGDVSWL